MISDYSQKYKKSEAWRKLCLSIRLVWSGLNKFSSVRRFLGGKCGR